MSNARKRKAEANDGFCLPPSFFFFGSDYGLAPVVVPVVAPVVAPTESPTLGVVAGGVAIAPAVAPMAVSVYVSPRAHAPNTSSAATAVAAIVNLRLI
jgi:hypothetical protein